MAIRCRLASSAVDSALSLVEGCPQVGHKVVGRLYSDRQPNERIRDLEQRARDGGVSHDCRHLEERLDSAERFGEGEDAGRLAYPDCSLASGSFLNAEGDEAHHAAWATH